MPEYAQSAATVIGVEPDSDLVPAARARTPKAEVLPGSAEQIPLDNDSVDVVHARFAYFFPTANNDCSAGLAEVLRVLRPGGSLVVIDNDHRNGEFADLLALSSSAASSQGVDHYIRQWWADRGADRQEVMSSWKFSNPTDLRAVISMEFPPEIADPWLSKDTNRVRLSYGYVLHHVTKGELN